MYADHTTAVVASNGESPIPSIPIEQFESLLRQGAIADEGTDCTNGFTYFHILLPDVYWADGSYTCYYKVRTDDVDTLYNMLSKQEVKKFFLRRRDFNSRLIIDDQLVGEPNFSFTESECDDSIGDELNDSMVN